MSEVVSDRMKAVSKSEKLQFFIAENTSGRREFYLAENAKSAKILASFHRLVESAENARILVPTEMFWDGEPGFRGAVQRAIAANQPGKIVKRGQFAIMGDEVYAPIGEAI